MVICPQQIRSSRWFLRLLVVLALLALDAGFHAKAQDSTFGTGATLVTVPTNVVDAQGHPVWDLTARDFAVYDNGRLQSITIDDSPSRSRALVILVEEDDNSLMLKDSLNRGLIDFINGLPAAPTAIAIMTVGVEPLLALPFTSDRDLVMQKLKTLRPDASPSPPSLGPGRNGPALVDGLFQAARLLAEKESNSDKSILLVSTAKDGGSIHTISETLNVIGGNDITVHALEYSSVEMGLLNWWSDVELTRIALNINALLNHAAGWLQQDIPKRFAIASGGIAQVVSRTGRVSGAVLTIDAQLPVQYPISFRPKDSAPGLHSLRVVIPTRSNLIIRSRVFYWMQGDAVPR
jgi:VWFA-related protein